MGFGESPVGWDVGFFFILNVTLSSLLNLAGSHGSRGASAVLWSNSARRVMRRRGQIKNRVQGDQNLFISALYTVKKKNDKDLERRFLYTYTYRRCPKKNGYFQNGNFTEEAKNLI